MQDLMMIHPMNYCLATPLHLLHHLFLVFSISLYASNFLCTDLCTHVSLLVLSLQHTSHLFLVSLHYVAIVVKFRASECFSRFPLIYCYYCFLLCLNQKFFSFVNNIFSFSHFCIETKIFTR